MSSTVMADDTKVPGKAAKAEQIRTLLTDYEEACSLLKGLQLAALEDGQSREVVTLEKDIKPIVIEGDASNITVSEKMFCSYCEFNFKDRSHQKSHYKTDWHRYNLRQKIKCLDPISEDKFEELVVGDISSISGSESSDNSEEDEDDKTKKFALPQPIFNRTGAESSDSDDEMSAHVEGIGRRHPRVFVRNDQGQLLSIYRCVVHSKKNQPEDQAELLSMVASLPQQTKWVVLMTAAGHFAAAVFDKGVVVAHKTFHRYTVRAKRGTAQGLKDSKGNAPHSAGASLRRYNEAALAQEVSDLLTSWSVHMKSCDRIFLRAPSFNRAMFFGGKNPPLDKKDPRIRMIPFPTRRPTFSELQRVHSVLATIECYGEESTIHDYIQTPPKQPTQARPKKSSPEKQRPMKKIEEGTDEDSDEEDNESEGVAVLVSTMQSLQTDHLNAFEATKKTKRKKKKKTATADVTDSQVAKETDKNSIEFTEEEYQLRNELYTACKVGNFDRLKELLLPLLPNDIMSTNPDSEESRDTETSTGTVLSTQGTQSESSEQGATTVTPTLTPELLNAPFGDSRRTLLHVAVTQNNPDTVTYLLEAGADPSILDWQDRPPYLVANQKPMRNQFRQFLARYPERYDYVKAQIPPPVSSEREAEKKVREAERRKVAKKARKDRLKEKKAEEAEKAAEQKEQERYLKLSDREKRALAAERRLTEQLTTEGKATPTLSRCWQCGVDITGKVPFEYYDYKFCTPKCLKDHKLSNKSR